MTIPDTRKKVGSRVYAKAIHVTAAAECARRFGSRAKTKMIPGVVIDVRVEKTTNNRTNNIIIADFTLGGLTIKRAELNIRSIHMEPADPQDHIPQPAQDNGVVGTPQSSAAPSEHEDNSTIRSVNVSVVNEDDDGLMSTDEVIAQLMDQDDTTGTIPNNNNDNDVSPPAVPGSPASRTRSRLATRSPVAAVHGANWYKDDNATRLPMNGPMVDTDFTIKTSMGDNIGRCSDRNHRWSRLEYFIFMFPPAQLNLMVNEANVQLEKENKQHTTKGEVLKFIGMCILITRFEFGNRSTLWSTTAPSKYIPAASLGRTGMKRHRFDDLWKHMRFSQQPDQRPEGMSSESYRWKLVDDFVTNFNQHRESMFVPSSLICVDESISRWYGLGGDWINMGLPMYVAIDRKPESGCEIQDAACGKSGIMISLKLVKTASLEEEANGNREEEDGMLHGTKVLLHLVSKWAHSDRMVCADSYFASVGAAQKLREIGLKFIGVVKTATKKFPMKYLSEIELEKRGDREGLVLKGEGGRPELLAFVWMDRDRRYFIASGSSLQEGEEYVRDRWRQVSDVPEADPERVTLRVPQPKAAEMYYKTCAAVDQHNRHRQATLKLETKLKTTDWSKRVNMTLLGITIVDTWLAWSQATGSKCTQSEFYNDLAEELIDNNYDRVGGTGSRQQPTGSENSPLTQNLINPRTGSVRAGISIHLTPTKKKRKRKDGTVTNHLKQGYCNECGKKTKYNCSKCLDEMGDEGTTEKWLCHTETGRDCFLNHMNKAHDV